MVPFAPAIALGLSVFIGGCSPAASQPCPREPAAQPGDASAPSSGGVVSGATGPGSPSQGADSTAPQSAETGGPPPLEATPPAGSLPELSLTLIGMHIGGGPNDEETKRPFVATITEGFEAMRACYRLAEQPEKGGTFGVDLRIESAGGSPAVQAVRTAMKGSELSSCLTQAFAQLRFGKPARGATVLSASVHFSLKE
jgi:hypothetical protein